ncbi:hypothetical protein Tco_0585090 [Tanacetum coccineum]
MKSAKKMEEDDVTKENGAKRKKSIPRKSTRKRQKMEEDAEKGDGSSKNYKILSEMLEDFDRLDVEELYRLVKERYSTSRPEGFDLMLWGDLHTLFEPDEDDEIWKDQHKYNLLSWRLCDFYGIHILLMENGLEIHMLTEKKYPLSQEMLTKMLSRKLEVDHESSQAFELLRFIRSQVGTLAMIKSLKKVLSSSLGGRRARDNKGKSGGQVMCQFIDKWDFRCCCDPITSLENVQSWPKNNDQRAFIGGAWSDNGEDEVIKD